MPLARPQSFASVLSPIQQTLPFPLEDCHTGENLRKRKSGPLSHLEMNRQKFTSAFSFQ